jgi:hypothetical protein
MTDICETIDENKSIELDIINSVNQCIPHCSQLCDPLLNPLSDPLPNPSFNPSYDIYYKKYKEYEEYKEIHKKIQEYLFSHRPLYKKKYNYESPLESKENTYLINKISANIINKIVKFLKFSKYNEINFSLYDTQICALTYKKYAFYKSTIDDFGKTIYVFCYQNDKKCSGILLSPVV